MWELGQVKWRQSIPVKEIKMYINSDRDNTQQSGGQWWQSSFLFEWPTKCGKTTITIQNKRDNIKIVINQICRARLEVYTHWFFVFLSSFFFGRFEFVSLCALPTVWNGSFRRVCQLFFFFFPFFLGWFQSYTWSLFFLLIFRWDVILCSGIIFCCCFQGWCSRYTQKRRKLFLFYFIFLSHQRWGTILFILVPPKDEFVMVVEDTTPFFSIIISPSERVRPFPGTALLLLKTKNPRVIFFLFF